VQQVPYILANAAVLGRNGIAGMLSRADSLHADDLAGHTKTPDLIATILELGLVLKEPLRTA
jgi:hypothetical protein